MKIVEIKKSREIITTKALFKIDVGQRVRRNADARDEEKYFEFFLKTFFIVSVFEQPGDKRSSSAISGSARHACHLIGAAMILLGLIGAKAFPSPEKPR